MGNGVTCTIHCNYRITATLYTLETQFVRVCNRKYLTQQQQQQQQQQ